MTFGLVTPLLVAAILNKVVYFSDTSSKRRTFSVDLESRYSDFFLLVSRSAGGYCNGGFGRASDARRDA